MKSKGLTYLLLIVVGIIWYNVFFRIKDNLTDNETVLNSPHSYQTTKIASRKDFDLKANYRDPFCKDKKIEGNVETPLTKEQKIIAPPKIHRWAKFIYFGTVKNNQSKKALCIINIDDMHFNLREGDVVLDGIQIKKIFRDSVLVQQGKDFKMVRK